MIGHIKMGAVGETLRAYALLDPSNYQATLANPFAAKINTQDEYGVFDSFDEWTQTDWQVGAGKRDPKAGGFLYANMDTRFPNQMILPMGLDFPHYFPLPSGGTSYVKGDLTVDGTTITRAASSFLSRSILARSLPSSL